MLSIAEELKIIHQSTSQNERATRLQQLQSRVREEAVQRKLRNVRLISSVEQLSERASSLRQLTDRLRLIKRQYEVLASHLPEEDSADHSQGPAPTTSQHASQSALASGEALHRHPNTHPVMSVGGGDVAGGYSALVEGYYDPRLAARGWQGSSDPWGASSQRLGRDELGRSTEGRAALLRSRLSTALTVRRQPPGGHSANYDPPPADGRGHDGERGPAGPGHSGTGPARSVPRDHQPGPEDHRQAEAAGWDRAAVPQDHWSVSRDRSAGGQDRSAPMRDRSLAESWVRPPGRHRVEWDGTLDGVVSRWDGTLERPPAGQLPPGAAADGAIGQPASESAPHQPADDSESTLPRLRSESWLEHDPESQRLDIRPGEPASRHPPRESHVRDDQLYRDRAQERRASREESRRATEEWRDRGGPGRSLEETGHYDQEHDRWGVEPREERKSRYENESRDLPIEQGRTECGEESRELEIDREEERSQYRSGVPASRRSESVSKAGDPDVGRDDSESPSDEFVSRRRRSDRRQGEVSRRASVGRRSQAPQSPDSGDEQEQAGEELRRQESRTSRQQEVAGPQNVDRARQGRQALHRASVASDIRQNGGGGTVGHRGDGPTSEPVQQRGSAAGAASTTTAATAIPPAVPQVTKKKRNMDWLLDGDSTAEADQPAVGGSSCAPKGVTGVGSASTSSSIKQADSPPEAAPVPASRRSSRSGSIATAAPLPVPAARRPPDTSSSDEEPPAPPRPQQVPAAPAPAAAPVKLRLDSGSDSYHLSADLGGDDSDDDFWG